MSQRARPVAAAVIVGPGTNRDPDASLALELAGASPAIVSAAELAANPGVLDRFELALLAGGFSFGDALGAGRMLALELEVALGDRLISFVTSGRPVIGICNGFQVLTRIGLLPGALGHNDGGHFDCRWVELAAPPDTRCVWTRDLPGPVRCPIAHGEGRFVHPDPAGLAAAGQVALRYASPNPNGSMADIAGVCDESGLVLGLMPHPENHVVPRQDPRRRRGRHDPSTSGLHLFRNGVQAAEEAR